MSSRSMTYEEHRRAQIAPFASRGPCTAKLNAFAEQTNYGFAYDLNAVQTEQYYIKRTHQQWRKHFWRADVDDPEMREFEDDDTNLAYQCLRQFQETCDKYQISTRSAVEFYRDLHEAAVSTKATGHRLAMFQMFALALADSGFLFDAAVVRYQPSFFITRASIAELKNVQEIRARKGEKQEMLSFTEREHLWNVLQEQVRDMHLMLPHHMTYSTVWEETVIPTLERLRSRAEAYGTHAAEPNDVPAAWENKEQIIKTVAQSYLWFLKCQRQFSWEKNQDNEVAEKTFGAMLDEGRFKSSKLYQCISELVDSAEKSPWATFAPLYFYRAMTAYFSRVLAFDPPAAPIITRLNLDKSCSGFKSTAQTAQKHYRCNLLLFRKLCHELSAYFPEYAIERARYLFEVTEDISAERYPSDQLLSAEPTSQEIKTYITNGAGGDQLIFSELFCLTERLKSSLAISPFELFPYRPWTVTEQDLAEFLYRAKASEDQQSSGEKHRGKRLPKHRIIQRELKAYDPTLAFEEYYQCTFKDVCGYGSGLPTYAWAFRVTEEIDKILQQSDELRKLFDVSPKYAELVELGIHACLLENLTARAERIALTLGKSLLYSRSIVEC